MEGLRVIGQAPMQTVRARALEGLYARPRKALSDLEQRGVVHRIAYSYYCLVPAGANPTTWKPDFEAAAAGVATAIWGDGVPILMGMSAARIHGALPRAYGKAIVAAPSGHRPIRVTDREATIQFVKRDVDALDAVRIGTELGRTLVTTPAQTSLDLARDPRVLEQRDMAAVIRAVLAQTSLDEVAEVASNQGRTGTALARVGKLAAS